MSVFLFCSTLFSQITINSGDIPNQVGTYFIYRADTFTLYNIGPSGCPHTWNFSLPSALFNDTSNITPPGSAPFYPDSYPNANLVEVYSTSEGGYNESYFYSELTSTYFRGLGYSFRRYMDTSYVAVVYNPYQTILNFPVT